MGGGRGGPGYLVTKIRFFLLAGNEINDPNDDGQLVNTCMSIVDVFFLWSEEPVEPVHQKIRIVLINNCSASIYVKRHTMAT